MKNRFTKVVLSLIIGVIIIIGVIGCTSQATQTTATTPIASSATSSATSATPATTRTVVDMAGRTVTVPANITRVVSSDVAINACLLPMGKKDTLISDLSESVKSRARYQYVFAPNIADGPDLDALALDVETILSLKPDVVFTWLEANLTKLEPTGIPVIYVKFKGADEIKAILKLMGQVFGDTERADQVIQFFDNKINEINAKVASIPTVQRPKVLYGNMQTLKAMYFTSEWCIDKAGGIPVAAKERVELNYQFNMEQLLTWNPDIIIVESPSDIDYVYSHTEFSSINAVKNKKVYVTPSCMGYYSGSSPEMPMAVEWMASKFYPDLFPENDMRKDIISFYKEFYGYELSESQLDEILGGLQ